MITFEDFQKLDIRIGKIIEAEIVPDSRKLLKIKVDLGTETRQVLSGIAKEYTPSELIGKQIVFLTNLAPKIMAGLESQGMILMAEVEGKAVLLCPEADVPLGARVC